MLQEFSDAKQMRAHYGAIRAKLFNPPKKPADLAARVRQPEQTQEWSTPNLVERVYVPIPDSLMAEAHRAIHPSPRAILAAVGKRYKVSPVALAGASRLANTVQARQVAMFLLRTLTGISFPRIGQLLGGRDHTTAMHGAKKIGRLIEIDPDLRADVQTIAQSVGGEL